MFLTHLRNTQQKNTTPSKLIISSLLTELFYHSSGGAEDDGLCADDVYIDLGEDSEEDLNQALSDRCDEALQNGLSTNGVSKLHTFFAKNKSIFD